MMAKENLAEMPENYDMMDEVKASAVMNETEEQKIVASNVNDNQEGENPPSPKGGAATKAVEENTVNENARDIKVYPHIVSRSLFDKVQEIFAQNGNHNRNDSENQAKYTYAFRGLIKCKECGGLITPATAIKKNGSKYSHLRCANYKKCCHQAAVMEYVIFEQLEKEVFNKLSLPSNMQEPLKEQILRNLTDTSKLNTTIKINVTKKINELKIKEDKLLDFYLEGKLTQEIYDIKKASIDKEIKGLEDTKEKYKTIDNDTKDKIVKTFTIAGNISYIFQHASPSRQNELLKMLLKDCQLNGKRLEYTLRKPFDTLIKNHNIKEWSNIAIKTIEEIC